MASHSLWIKLKLLARNKGPSLACFSSFMFYLAAALRPLSLTLLLLYSFQQAKVSNASIHLHEIFSLFDPNPTGYLPLNSQNSFQDSALPSLSLLSQETCWTPPPSNTKFSLLFVGRFLIIDTISLQVVNLFRFSIAS